MGARSDSRAVGILGPFGRLSLATLETSLDRRFHGPSWLGEVLTSGEWVRTGNRRAAFRGNLATIPIIRHGWGGSIRGNTGAKQADEVDTMILSVSEGKLLH
jgi:hypothetical protein